MATGTPVIAFRSGGVMESVIDGKTGVFFDKASTDSLARAMKKFEKSEIKSENCIKQAKKFSTERFKKQIKIFVKKHA
jgi:glycosyltransferase involved in cell wall biosynthesis